MLKKKCIWNSLHFHLSSWEAWQKFNLPKYWEGQYQLCMGKNHSVTSHLHHNQLYRVSHKTVFTWCFANLSAKTHPKCKIWVYLKKFRKLKCEVKCRKNALSIFNFGQEIALYLYSAAIAVFTGTWLECRSPARGRGTRCRRCGWSSPGWGWWAPASTPASSPSPTRRGPASCPPSTSCWGNIYTRASNEPSRKFHDLGEGPYLSWLKVPTCIFKFNIFWRHKILRWLPI